MEDAEDLRLVSKEQDKAYISNMLWLPKSGIRTATVQDSLQYWRVSKGSAVLEKLWEDSPHHLLVPREFISPEQYKNYSFPFIDISTQCFPRMSFTDRITLRDNQVDAWEALDEARGGILNLACGKGKTVLALKKIVSIGGPALIVVNDGLQLDQWQKAIAEHIDLPPGEEVGFFHGKKKDWKRPITIAVINSMAMAAKEGELPEGFADWFSCVFYDEVHHLSAPLFVNSAPVIKGLRFGLTATADRLDEKQWVYNYHLGGVFFSDLTQDLIPKVYFQKTPVTVDLESKEVRDKAGNVNISKLRTFLATDPTSLDFRTYCLQEAVDSGRKILAVSHSVVQLENLHERFPDSGLVTGSTPPSDRMDIVRNSRLCFVIAKLGTEALDDELLDALFNLTPYSSKNALQQMLGRIQRYVPDKPEPVAVIFDDYLIGPLHGLTMSLRKSLSSRGMAWTTLEAPTL